MFAPALARPETRIGALILLALIFVALAAPLLAPGDPLGIVGRPLIPPLTEAAHPLGTDRLGRDLLAGLIHGARTSLSVGLASALVALAAGSVIGALAGFLGGWLDLVLMRLVEAFQIVPGFLLALAFVSVSGPSLGMVVLAIALGAWTAPARLVRARVLALREADFVAAARLLGQHPLGIALRQILPLALPPVLSLTAVIVAGAILTEAALSFLGLGDPNRVTWGAMIAEGRNQLRSALWLSMLPGFALIITVISSYLLAEGLSSHLTGRGQG